MNRLTLSSVFFFFFFYQEAMLSGIHRRRGDAKANVTKKSALFGPLVMQNGFKV